MKAFKFYLCFIVVFFFALSGFSAPGGDTTMISDSIERITNLNLNQPPGDSATIKDIIAIKLITQKPISTFTTLYADGIKINNLKPWKVSESEKIVFFKLNDSLEHLLLRFTESKSGEKNILAVIFSVGTDTESLAKAKDPIYIEVNQHINPGWVWVMTILFLGLIFAAIKYNALKDDNNLYYSLSRTQLFYWTILFVFSYLYICFGTGSLPDIPGSILIILGISIGTTAATKVIENRPGAVVVIDPKAKSEGWFMDILSDGTSINIQRFQNVIFNLVFGIIFIQRTVTTNVLPAFDDNVLLLLGISSGAYAGLKLTEPTKEQQTLPPPVNNDSAPSQQANAAANK
jgi:hypothetical protein